MFSDPAKNIEQWGVDPGMRVADLGSGAGFYSLVLARMVGDTGRVFAVDVQQELLSKLKNNALQEGVANRIEVVWGDIDELNGSRLQNHSVDRVLVANVLFQVEDKEAVAKEAARILKPGGSLLVVDWADAFGGLGPQPSRIVTADQAQALFERAGFSVLRTMNAGDHHYGIVFKK